MNKKLNNGKFKRIIILIVILLLPQMTIAAWWNPFSWFSKKPINSEEVMMDESSKEISVEEKWGILDKNLSESNEEQGEENQNTSTLLNQIEKLKIENEQLRIQLNSCQISSTSNNTIDTVNVINTAELEKQNKLKKIDQEIFSYIDSELSRSPTSEERCSYLLDRITKYEFSSSSLASKEYEADCNLKPNISAIDKINELLAAYRLVDSKMTYGSITPSFDELRKLKNYLINTYIEYR